MKILSKLIRNEIFSISTIIFVVIPFAMSLSNPQTGKSQFTAMQDSLHSMVQTIPVSNIKQTIHKHTVSAINAIDLDFGKSSLIKPYSGHTKPASNPRPIYFND